MIKGWLRTSLIDFPGQIAAVLFMGGCNLRCPMCHNGDLIENLQALPDVPVDEVFDYLVQRKRRITGLVLSGGEPCLQPGLPALLERARGLGLKTKLDTNGTRPEVLAALMQEGLLDAAAMDIKAPREKYAVLSGVSVDLASIERSIALLRASGLWVEFRTTVVPGMLTPEDIRAIGTWLNGAPRYVLQQFASQHCYAETLRNASPYPAPVLQEMAEAASPYFDEVLVRGV